MTYQANWLQESLATQYFQTLKTEINWQQETILMFGKKILCPRLIAWYGDNNINYKYSGILHTAENWHPLLFTINTILKEQMGLIFNSVLCNFYRDGRDAMGWHADNEPTLGKNPSIASVSLGATRQFSLKHNLTKQRISLDLTHGSLLLMQNETQHYWQHSLPKTTKDCSERINLTFRQMINVDLPSG